LWLVDSYTDKVYKYAGAASRLSGSQSAASSFNLAQGRNGNSNPQDIVTNGTSFWVVDGSSLKVFKYTLSGTSLGSWAIDPANTQPTGITINPNNASDIWIVDNGMNKVYQYVGAASRTSGSQSAAATFTLAAGNTNPQGIADPPAGDAPVAAEPVSVPASFPAVRSSTNAISVAPGNGTVTSASDAAFSVSIGESLAEYLDLEAKSSSADRALMQFSASSAPVCLPKMSGWQAREGRQRSEGEVWDRRGSNGTEDDGADASIGGESEPVFGAFPRVEPAALSLELVQKVGRHVGRVC
jgi:hypothetical protein